MSKPPLPDLIRFLESQREQARNGAAVAVSEQLPRRCVTAYQRQAQMFDAAARRLREARA